MSEEALYTLENGVVLRDGKAIADISEDGKPKYRRNQKKYSDKVEIFLKAIADEEFPEESKPDPKPEEEIVLDAQAKEEAPPMPKPKPKLLPHPQEAYPEYKGLIDPASGDKTPQFVAWLFENYPEDAQKRYAGRKIPQVVL